MKTYNIQKGSLLVAEPFMEDPHFKRTVTLVCEHGEDGTIGLVLNRPSVFSVNQMVGNFPHIESTMFYGGPVGRDQLNFLHAYGDLIPNAFHIRDNLYWNGDFEALKELIKDKQIMPQNIRFFSGYAGWGEGQLLEEMQDESWIVSEDYPEIFRMSEYMWQEVLIQMGGKHKLIANFPENPQMN